MVIDGTFDKKKERIEKIWVSAIFISMFLAPMLIWFVPFCRTLFYVIIFLTTFMILSFVYFIVRMG